MELKGHDKETNNIWRGYNKNQFIWAFLTEIYSPHGITTFD